MADARGLSGYADHTLCQRLDLAPGALAGARAHLLRLGLIAYRPPLTQVLALPRPPAPRPPRRTDPLTARRHLQQLRQHLSGEGLS